MNEHFVNIKVDREERPDLDGIYMNAVVRMTGQGGWPLSVFLTPEGAPFFGGTYFPPVRRSQMPAFQEVLLSLARAWVEQRQEILEVGGKLGEHLQGAAQWNVQAFPLDAEALAGATRTLLKAYDEEHGGWGDAPKFPQPMAIEFLLRQATRGDESALKTACHALDAMSRGGMYDLVGGGFHRYSTDEGWLVPHFEKMLYDNAQLALAYLHAYKLTGRRAYRRVCEETLDFIERELRAAQGGFYSSLDADSEGEEGKYYLWAPGEIEAVLEDPQDYELFSAAFGLTPSGNFEGKLVLQRELEDDLLAQKFGGSPEEVADRLEKMLRRLREARTQRVRPATDDKVLVAWNALALQAFAQAARFLERQDYLNVAVRNAEFLLSALHPGEGLLRSWRDGEARQAGFLEDIAGLIVALLDLYQSDPNPGWFVSAVQLADEMLAHFKDPHGGFFDTRADGDTPLVRPKELQDNATPSGNALAATALLQLSAYTGRGDWRSLAEDVLGTLQETAARYPTAFACWLSAIDFAIGPVRQIAILARPGDPKVGELESIVWEDYRPRSLLARSEAPPSPQDAPLLAGRPLVDGKTTVYVCQGFVCDLPVTTREELASQLKG